MTALSTDELPATEPAARRLSTPLRQGAPKPPLAQPLTDELAGGPPAVDLSLALIAEAHHRAANSFQIACSSLARAACGVADAQARLALAGVGAQLHAFALLNERLHPVGAALGEPTVCAAGYIGELCAHLRSACLDPLQVQLDVHTPHTEMLPCSQGRHLGLVATELVLNAAKHAFAGRASGRVTVTLSRRSAASPLRMRVSDDGRGCEREAISVGEGMGLVACLVEAMRATLRLETGPQGTTIEVTLQPARAPTPCLKQPLEGASR